MGILENLAVRLSKRHDFNETFEEYLEKRRVKFTLVVFWDCCNKYKPATPHWVRTVPGLIIKCPDCGEVGRFFEVLENG